MSEQVRFFLPGPTYVAGQIAEAMIGPSISHRSPEMAVIYQRISERLPTIFRTAGPTLLISGSASLCWDIAIRSAVSGPVLNLCNGAFSERFHLVTKSCGRPTTRLDADWGQSIDPEEVRQLLRSHEFAAVTLTHSETSTGVLNPVAEIAAVVREESDALIFVDAVSSLAGVELEMDAWGLDLVFAGAQKALAVPPGLAVLAASERMVRRARRVEDRGYYTDLIRYLDKHRAGGTLTTPAIPQIRALDRQLDRIEAEGLGQRWVRHRELRSRAKDWADDLGLQYASAAGVGSPTVSCLLAPASMSAPDLVGKLRERGFVVAGGYGQWKTKTFRVGHMGEVQPTDLDALFSEIKRLI